MPNLKKPDIKQQKNLKLLNQKINLMKLKEKEYLVVVDKIIIKGA